MPRLDVFVAHILLTVSFGSCLEEKSNPNVEVSFVENLSDFLRMNADIKASEHLETQDEIKNVSVTYQIGSRLPGKKALNKYYNNTNLIQNILIILY